MTDNQVLGSPYIPTIQPQLAPAWIDHVLRYRNLPLPRRSETSAFSYIDLGCGYGTTMLCLAAAYPQACFTGTDANPKHIEFAKNLAERAGLTNVTFITANFGDPVLEDIPSAHYVVADGIYSWIPDDARAALMGNFDRMLRPGGAALISVNLMAGWLELIPVRRILADMQAAEPDTAPAALIEKSRRVINKLQTESRSAIIRKGAETFWKKEEEASENYIVHEYLPTGWQAFWSADIVRQFSKLGCLHIGEANLSELLDAHALTKAQQKSLAEVDDELLALTLRDSMAPRPFTRMLFHRPGDKTTPPNVSSRQDANMPSRQEGWIALSQQAADIKYECVTRAGKLTFESPTAHRIVDKLANGPAQLREIAHEVGPPSDDIFLSIIDSLCASHQLMPVDPPQMNGSVERLIKILEEDGMKSTYQASIFGTPM